MDTIVFAIFFFKLMEMFLFNFFYVEKKENKKNEIMNFVSKTCLTYTLKA